METTRRFPRTMSEAFPQESHWIEVYRRPSRWLRNVSRAAVCFGACVLIGYLLSKAV